MKNEILLTISLLASNRKETIRKCLDSVKPLLEQIPSELIITDTGCDKETRAILEEYTGNIIPFTWCNNFAVARNVGLKAAKGKWFLYLDDDEWFDSVEEFITFFQSGEYKKFHSAFYMQRNYANFTGKVWTDYKVVRMVELHPDTEFIYSIHECFNGTYAPIKTFKAFVHHYGYVYRTKEEQEKHSMRNLKPLLEENQKDPQNLRHHAQIAQEYMALTQYENVCDIARKGINDTKNNRNKNVIMLNILFRYDIESLYHQQKEEELLQKTAEYSSDANCNLVCRAGMRMRAVEAAYHLNKYELAGQYTKEYLKGYQTWDVENQKQQITAGLILEATFLDKSLWNVTSFGALAMIELENWDSAESFCREIDWSAERLFLPEEFVPQFTRCMTRFKAPAFFGEVGNRILNRDGLGSIFTSTVEKEYLRTLHSEDSAEIQRLSENVQFLERKHWIISSLQICYADSQDNQSALEELFQYMLKNTKNLISIVSNTGLWRIADKRGIGIDFFYKDLEPKQWFQEVNEWCSKATEDRISDMKQRMEKVIDKEDMKYCFLENKILEKKLRLLQEQGGDFASLTGMLREYSERSIAFYHEIYQSEVFDKMESLLPLDCRFSTRMLEVLNAIERAEYEKAVSGMSTLYDIYPNMKLLMKRYLLLLKDYIEEENRERDEAQSELQLLAEQIREKIEVLIQAGQQDIARNMAEQLQQMIPDDTKTEELLLRLRTKDSQ